MADLFTITKSQCDRILDHLESGKTLTALVALDLFDCLNLKGRIWDLRNIIRYGHPNIEKRWLALRNGKRVAQYFIKG